VYDDKKDDYEYGNRSGSEISTVDESDDYTYTDSDTKLEDDIDEITIHVDEHRNVSDKIVVKSILQDMVSFDISPDIKEKANDVYNMLDISTKRGGRRKKVVFFCLYEAHRLMRIPIDPKDLAKIVGIGKNHISKAFTMCSPIETAYTLST